MLALAIGIPFFSFAQIAETDISAEIQALLDTSVVDTYSGLPEGVSEQLSLDITPTNPRPFGDVTLRITSNATDLNKANITWRVNSAVSLKQIGATTFTFTMGRLGESKAVNVSIEKYGGGVLEKTYFFIPTEVDLIYSADTYTPPFYKGKSWPTHQSTIRVLALPRILDDYDRLISPDSYVYTWRRDGRVVQDQSGYGKNVFTYTNGLLDADVKISVEASPREYNTVASASVIIDPVEPEIVVYEKNPIYGTIFEQAVTGTYYLTRNEITFEAIPYFFNKNTLDLSWVMNGQQITNLSNPREVTFRIEEDEAGRSDIGIQVTNSDKILQSASNGFTLLFEKIADATTPNNF